MMITLPQNWAKLAVLFRFFSIAMDGDNSFYVKFIATEEPTFFGYIISVLVMVSCNSTSVNASRAKNDVIKSWLYTVTCNLN